eukprot:TRINITY_DN6467_c0_g1_i1.p2 TRINITY_DN6467_c0_g1~~TRINITY_DN6467_c0_g1_i1.p2  ORF type:complete len:127 (-),score=36.48 TRINITY_DN6467_c0_g1_i1:126-506(-)
MRASDLMVPKGNLIIATPECTIQMVAERMLKADVGACPLLNEHAEPVGIITLKDLVRAAYQHTVAPDALASTLMAGVLVMVRETDTREHVAAVIAEHHLHHVLVANAEGHLVGMLSSLDVAMSHAR